MMLKSGKSHALINKQSANKLKTLIEYILVNENMSFNLYIF